MPKIIANVVITMGRSRNSPASIRAARRSLPFSLALLAKSTMRIAFLVTRPMSMITPIMLMMLKVPRVTMSPSMTPIRERGSDSMMASGWRKLPNCDARIR